MTKPISILGKILLFKNNLKYFRKFEKFITVLRRSANEIAAFLHLALIGQNIVTSAPAIQPKMVWASLDRPFQPFSDGLAASYSRCRLAGFFATKKAGLVFKKSAS